MSLDQGDALLMLFCGLALIGVILFLFAGDEDGMD